MINPSDICVLVPTYENGGTILDVVGRVLSQHQNLLVVDDGSTDGTRDLLLEKYPEVEVLSLPKNMGKGKALSNGFTYLRDKGYRYAITLDADGQHYPEDLPLFLGALEGNEGALVIGSRNLQSENMPGKSTFANRLSNFFFTVQTLRRIPDTQTGFRAYPLEKLPSLSLLTSRYEAELELLVLSAWKGVRLLPIDIRVYYPPREERVTHFRPGKDFARIFVLNTVLCILAVVYGYPRMLLSKIFHLGK